MWAFGLGPKMTELAELQPLAPGTTALAPLAAVSPPAFSPGTRRQRSQAVVSLQFLISYVIYCSVPRLCWTSAPHAAIAEGATAGARGTRRLSGQAGLAAPRLGNLQPER